MSGTIEVQGNVRTSTGATIAVLSKQEAEAILIIDVSIKKGAVAEVVQLTDPQHVVQFLLIQSTPYGAGLSYSVNAAEADANKRVKLDAFQLLIRGAVQLLHDPPQSLFFYNNLSEDAALRIIVGKPATTPAPPPTPPTPPSPTPPTT